jgi:hypothetical protein
VNQQLQEFCVKLKKERLAKRVALEDIAEVTRINLKFLKAIEEGNLDILPPIYVRIFLKKYIECLGLDLTQVLAEFDQASGAPAPVEPAATDTAAQPTAPPPTAQAEPADPLKRLMPFFLGIVFIFLVGYFVVGKLMREEPAETSAPDETPIAVPAVVEAVPAVESVAVAPALPAPVVAAAPVPTRGDSFALIIRGIEKTWCMVVRDAADTLTKGMCRPNQIITVRAAARVVVSLGKPRGQQAAVSLELNGKSLGEWGAPGTSFTRFTVTKDGVDRASLIVKKAEPPPAAPAKP